MTAPAGTAAPPPAADLRGRGHHAERAFKTGVLAAAALVVVLLAATAAFLLNQSWPALQHYGALSFLGSSRWAPSNATAAGTSPNPYGIEQFIYGTVITSVIGMVIALPVAAAVGLFITQIAPAWLRRPLSYLVDLLAAVPSVVYGFWGVFALIPALRPVANFLITVLGGIPVIGSLFAGPFFGVSYFAAGVVLAIMVLPIVTAILREVFATAPADEKEAALALGLTRWEMIRLAVLPRSRSGIIGAAVLGLGRAIGETIAVTMVIGNSVLSITASIFGQGATMPSVIANEFTEATEPYHLQSLFVVAAWLLVIALIVNVVGRYITRQTRGGLT